MGVLQNEDTVTNLSVPGQIIGTVAYMSPEQIQEQEVDQRSDLVDTDERDGRRSSLT